MSLTIDVVRGLGDNPGPDITCSHFEDEATYRQRGRVEIDKSARGLKNVSITLPGMRTHVRPGRIVAIDDIDGHHRGKVSSIQFSVGRSPDGAPFAACSLGLRLLKVA